MIQKGNIEKLTNQNTYYRKVISTTPQQQLVLMCLKPLEEIGMEKHPHTTQFIRVESGRGKAVVGKSTYRLSDDSFIIIPPNKCHNIINTSKTKPLKLYTIYSPPEHKPGTKQKRK